MTRAALFSHKEPRDVIEGRLANHRRELSKARSRLAGVTGDTHWDDYLRDVYRADVANCEKQIELLESIL